MKRVLELRGYIRFARGGFISTPVDKAMGSIILINDTTSSSLLSRIRGIDC